eukprot:JP447145.1.p2 GENE.JP447145.1~~JP447145.1.p2  ORF type:complete len:134 (-),score=17.61 JP447145.1:76-477(-)
MHLLRSVVPREKDVTRLSMTAYQKANLFASQEQLLATTFLLCGVVLCPSETCFCSGQTPLAPSENVSSLSPLVFSVSKGNLFLLGSGTMVSFEKRFQFLCLRCLCVLNGQNTSCLCVARTVCACLLACAFVWL